MASLNRVELIGHLGRDPEQKLVGDAKLVTFPIAMTDSWTDKRSGERQERTEWANISVWNEAVGEIAMKYLKKGSRAFVEGRLETRSWDQDGKTNYATDVVVRPYNGQIILLDRVPDRPADAPAGRTRRGASAEPSGRR